MATEPSPRHHHHDVISLRGLRVLGRHGVLAEEKARAQPFEVDVDLEVDLRRAGASDDLADTVDYGAVADAVAAVVGGDHCDLIEAVAERVAAAVVAAAGPGAALGAVTVTVRKLRPPVAQHLDHAAVTVRREASEVDGR